MNTPERAIVQALVDGIKAESFSEGYKATDAEAFGLLTAKFFHWNGLHILRAAQYAAEDANFHTESGQISAMADALTKVDDSALIDRDTRSALFASLNEVYPGISKDRSRRLAKFNLLANRPASDPILSLSDRACNMTMGDARRVFDILNEMRELSA